MECPECRRSRVVSLWHSPTFCLHQYQLAGSANHRDPKQQDSWFSKRGDNKRAEMDTPVNSGPAVKGLAPCGERCVAVDPMLGWAFLSTAICAKLVAARVAP